MYIGFVAKCLLEATDTPVMADFTGIIIFIIQILIYITMEEVIVKAVFPVLNTHEEV